MYLFVPCDKKSHGTERSFPIRSNCLSHLHPLSYIMAVTQDNVVFNLLVTPPRLPKRLDLVRMNV